MGASERGEHIGRYEILAPLGRGGMAEVFLAQSEPTPGAIKRVVLKRILPEHSGHAEFRSMFLSEARLTTRLSHGNVVQVFDAGEVDGDLFIVMEFVDGVTLDRLCQRLHELKCPGLPPELAALILIEVLKGLHHAHTRLDEHGRPLQIVHRDISPDNILIGWDGQVKVSDFGIAKAKLEGRRDTRPGIFKGKHQYGAPEQARAERIDARADIFAAGVVLHELVAGQNPLNGRMLDVVVGGLEVPRLNPELADPVFAGIVARAINPSAERRFSSALAFESALMEWAAPRLGGRMSTALFGLVQWLFEGELRERKINLAAPPGLVDWLETTVPRSAATPAAAQPLATPVRDDREAPTRTDRPRGEPKSRKRRSAWMVAGAVLSLALISFGGIALIREIKNPYSRLARYYRAELAAPESTGPMEIVTPDLNGLATIVKIHPAGSVEVERRIRALEEGKTADLPKNEYLAHKLREEIQFLGYSKSHNAPIVVGRLVLPRGVDVGGVMAQTNPIDDGYFVTDLRSWQEALEIRGTQIEPLNLRLQARPAPLAWLGEIPVARVDPARGASIRGHLTFGKGGAGQDPVIVMLVPVIRQNTTAEDLDRPRLTPGVESVDDYAHALLPPGEDTFEISGIAPGAYEVRLGSIGSTEVKSLLTLAPGQHASLELAAPLEPATELEFDALALRSTFFRSSTQTPKHVKMNASAPFWEYRGDAECTWALQVNQTAGQFTIQARGDLRAADLGEGTFDSFLGVDSQTAPLRDAEGVVLVHGHGYLYDYRRNSGNEDFRREPCWVLLRVQ